MILVDLGRQVGLKNPPKICLTGLACLDEQQLLCLLDAGHGQAGAGEPHPGASSGAGAGVNSSEVAASQGARASGDLHQDKVSMMMKMIDECPKTQHPNHHLKI